MIEVDDALGVRAPGLGRNDEAVGDQIVNERRAHRPGIAQPVDLHGARAASKNRRARAHGVALQIDQDVEPVIPDAAHRHVIRLPGDLDEVLRA